MCIVELGGTVGDIKSMPFIEALGSFNFASGQKIFVWYVSLVPVVGSSASENETDATLDSSAKKCGIGTDDVGL